MREDVRLRVSHVPDLQSGAVATGPLTVIYPGRASRPVMLFFCPLRAYQRSTDRQFYCFFPFISQTYSPLFPCFSVRFFLLFRKQACSAPFHVFLLFPKQGSFMSVSFFHNVPCFRPIQLSLQLEKLLPYIGCRDNYGSIELKFCI